MSESNREDRSEARSAARTAARTGAGAKRTNNPVTNNPVPNNPVIAFLRNTWRGLTSMGTALVLLFLLALGAVPGALLPQRSLNAGKVDDYLVASIGRISNAITSPLGPTRSAATCDQPPGAAPRSTITCPGLIA